MPDLGAIQKGLDDATTGFKQMQTALLVFAAAVTIAVIVIAVKLSK